MIATPAPAVPNIIAAAGAKGAATAAIVTAGLGHGAGSLADACERAARATGLRLVGPTGADTAAASVTVVTAAICPTISPSMNARYARRS